MQDELTPIVAALISGLRIPVIGRIVGTVASGATVLVDTVAALDLASAIGSLELSLATIKTANGALPAHLQSVLDAGKSTTSLIPFVTAADIEACVDTHRLHVSQRIDLDAVAEVDRLVDAHTVLVAQLSQGVVKAVQHSIEQDHQWASRLSPVP